MFKEITAQLPVRNHDSTIGFKVDIDVDTGEVIDVYADKREYDDFPTTLKRLNWKTGQNSLFRFVAFIHADKPEAAWAYLKKHALYDLDE